MNCKTAQSMITAYIQHNLPDKQLEEFVEHISGCHECREELEIYFTIHFALQRLDEDKNISYNIKKMLEDDLEATEHKVKRRKYFRIFHYGVMFAAELVLALILITQIELWNKGSIQETFIYQMMYRQESVTEVAAPVEVLETDENMIMTNTD